jgi:hypothetical protein
MVLEWPMVKMNVKKMLCLLESLNSAGFLINEKKSIFSPVQELGIISFQCFTFKNISKG